jgi:hypothetical protein
MLSKNDRITQEEEIMLSMHCLSLFTEDKISIYHSHWAKNIKYFMLKKLHTDRIQHYLRDDIF